MPILLKCITTEFDMLPQALILDILSQTKELLSPSALLESQLARLPYDRPIHVFAVGKAAYQMAKAVLDFADRTPDLQIADGMVITRYDHAGADLPRHTIFQSGHPLPDAHSVLAADAAIDYLSRLPQTDLLLVLLSGGGSALLEKPAAGYSLEEIILATRAMLHSGADIATLNAKRKLMSAVKGGKLLQHVTTRDVVILAMSDVAGDNPQIIASNPFMPEGFTDEFHHLAYHIIANNLTFCEGIATTARQLLPEIKGNMIQIVNTDLRGDAVKAGREIGKLARFILKQQERGLSAFRLPCLLIFGGETTVTVTGTGVGGRNCELALSAAIALNGLPNVVLCAYATDGSDGVAASCGAIITGETFNDLAEKGISADAILQDNDSYTALNAVSATLPANPTGINLNDIVILYLYL